MRKKGFTLVEVIVVAVIVAILAAVAIPMYRNYIQNAALSAAEQVAVTIAGAIAAERMNGISLGATAGTAALTTSDRTVSIGGNTVTVPRGMIVSTSIGPNAASVLATHNAQSKSFTKVIGL